MNRGLILRALRELIGVTAAMGIILLIFEAILAYVMPTFSRRFAANMAQFEFMQTVIKAMVGVESAVPLGREVFWAIPWAHPVVLALSWAHAIIACTRVPAGEVDRGTIDVLMGLPISRRELLLSETAAWLISAFVVMMLALAGNLVGRAILEPELRANAGHVAMAAALLLCLYTCVGGIAWLISSLSDRRGRAMAIGFVCVLFPFLLNYLSQFWAPARSLAFLSILDYYQPYHILRDGAFPWRDAIVLLAVGAASWTVGGVIFARRDLASL